MKETIPEEAPLIVHPRTIDELRLYAQQKGMPLEKMRFFVGVNYTEPRAFGIYQDGDRFIVYKNKASGDRAVRYHGPDEAYAVNEIFQKLLQECHNRGIYPDRTEQPIDHEAVAKARRRAKLMNLLSGGVMAVVIIVIIASMYAFNKDNGYYRKDNTLYYRDGSSWYYYDDTYDDWYYYYGRLYDYDDYYLGKSYSSSYGGSNVRDSDTWDDHHTSSSSSSDYDSWDSSDTDWDSDW
ncbi:MAG: hypothetical protein IJJ23_09850 [Clostridia bacterium]|nr:hypothetical protein [Clostridia bacterium]